MNLIKGPSACPSPAMLLLLTTPADLLLSLPLDASPDGPAGSPSSGAAPMNSWIPAQPEGTSGPLKWTLCAGWLWAAVVAVGWLGHWGLSDLPHAPLPSPVVTSIYWVSAVCQPWVWGQQRHVALVLRGSFPGEWCVRILALPAGALASGRRPEGFTRGCQVP